ncbi:hypothetical protein F5X68DRAFT_192534 [Plectosphaerella plurivora]|uniref:C3H1-type domain-containing protein n=1 Tax=Plectosphaerella plurivora TaxID=936078 RepID=A0A9P8V7I2_9PEZI|nr:hypothetical protein F5X68DRAFT_192534 [Plectosphaerella plurivora]
MTNAAFLKPLKTGNQPKKGLQQSSHNPINDTFPSLAMALRPTHYLVRPRLSPQAPAICVPLIPIDLLPELVELAGVPRKLRAAQVVGMHNVGTYERPADFYKVNILSAPAPMTEKTTKAKKNGGGAPLDRDETSTSGRSTSDDETSFGVSTRTDSMSQPSSDTDDNKGLKIKGAAKKKAAKAQKVQVQAQVKNNTKAKAPTPPGPSAAERILASASAASAHHLAPSKKGKVNKQQTQKQAVVEPGPSIIPDLVPNQTSPATTASSMSATPPARKIGYCRQYCLHGSCRYGNKCYNRHEMPTTLEGLQSVGLDEWPQWYSSWMRMVNQNQVSAQMSLSPFAAGQHSPYQARGMGMSPFVGQKGQGQGQLSAAEKKRRDKEQVRRAEERLRELEAEKAEGEKAERVRAAKASKLSAAHAAAAKAALGMEEEDMMLLDM